MLVFFNKMSSWIKWIIKLKSKLSWRYFNNVNRRRFGLFSLPGANALGDDSKHYIPPNHKKPDGSVETGPKNFLVGDRRKKYFS